MPKEGVTLAALTVEAEDPQRPAEVHDLTNDDVISASSASSAFDEARISRNKEHDALFVEGFIVLYTDGAYRNNQGRAKCVAGLCAFWVLPSLSHNENPKS